MSAVQRAEPDARGEWSATTHGVAGVVECLPAVDLPTLDAAASLLTRVDRKYVVALATFDRLVHGLAELGGWQALEVDRRRLFGYESVYFDTPDLATYRAHLQGRRRRSPSCTNRIPRSVWPRSPRTAERSWRCRRRAARR